MLMCPALVSVVSCAVQQESAACNATFADDVVRITGAEEAGLQGDTKLANVVFVCRGKAISALSLSVREFVDAAFGNIEALILNGRVTCGAPAVAGARLSLPF